MSYFVLFNKNVFVTTIMDVISVSPIYWFVFQPIYPIVDFFTKISGTIQM